MRAHLLPITALIVSGLGCEDAGPGASVADAAASDGRVVQADAVVSDAPEADLGAPSPTGDAGNRADASAAMDASSTDGGPEDASGPDASADDAGARDGAVSNDAGSCAATSGFCWIHPRGLGASLHSVSGAADDDVWAVGLAGVIVHFDQQGLVPWPSPTSSSLNDVHARTTSDVWAVGDAGTVIHFDGATWRAVPGIQGDDLRAVFAVGPNSVWIAGARRLYRYDGQSIADAPLPFTYDLGGSALFALADDDVWLGTIFGTALHYDGSVWSYSEGLDHNRAISDLWGASPNDLWAVSDYPLDISRFDGTEWRQVPYVPGSSPENVGVLHGRAANDVWLAGQGGLWHYDGQSFTRHDPPLAPYTSIEPRGAWVGGSRAFVVGISGHVFEWSGGAWSLESGPEQGIYMRWFDIEPVAPDEVWFFGLGTSMRYDGQSMTEVPTVPTNWRQDFSGSWARTPQDMWIVGAGQWGDNVQRFDGNSFSRVPSGNFFGPDWVFGVWGSSESDIYFAAAGDSFHWDGGAFRRLNVNAAFQSIHGTGPNDVWAASGTGGSSSVPPHPSNGIWHYDGQSWTQPVQDGTWWSSVYAVAPNDVWAGGGGGTVKHWDGLTWTTMPITGVTTSDPQNAPFVSSFGVRAPNDVYAVAGQRLLHWDGNVWTVLPSFGVGLSAVAVASDGAVYVTGGSDAVLRKR